MDALEASVRITEAFLDKTGVAHLELRVDYTDNSDEVGRRIGELFKVIHRAVMSRNEE